MRQMNETNEFPERCSREALVAQLTQLNNRALTYAARLWQMPIAYLAIVCLALSKYEDISNDWIKTIVSGLLFLSGGAIAWLISIHNSRIEEIISMVDDIESALHLEKSMKSQKVIPHYILVSLGGLAAIFANYIK